MLTIEAKIRFDRKLENPNALDEDIDTRNIIRPAINFGENLLFSGTIQVDKYIEILELGSTYDAVIVLPTIGEEAYDAIGKFLNEGSEFKIQTASKVIGKCTLLKYSFQ